MLFLRFIPVRNCLKSSGVEFVWCVFSFVFRFIISSCYYHAGSLWQFTKEIIRKYMLFAGWEVRIVKNYDRGLTNVALWPQAEGSIFKPEVTFSFSLYGPTKPANNIFFLAVLNWLTSWPVYPTLSLNCLHTIVKNSNERTNKYIVSLDTRHRKMF